MASFIPQQSDPEDPCDQGEQQQSGIKNETLNILGKILDQHQQPSMNNELKEKSSQIF